MPRVHFDPPTLGKRDIPALAKTAAVLLTTNVIVAAVWHQTLMRNYTFWQAFFLFALSVATGWYFYYLILRPIRGMPPLFRKRKSDDFETWVAGNGFKLSRLRERYSSDELILLFGFQLAILLAMLLYANRM